MVKYTGFDEQNNLDNLGRLLETYCPEVTVVDTALENLLLQLNQSKEEHGIALPTLKETRLIRTRDIVRLESSNNYSHIYLTSGEKLTASRPIHEYEDLLKDYGFLRCHQSHLVNRVYIKSLLREDGGTLLLEDGSRVPVSRNKKGAMLEALGL